MSANDPIRGSAFTFEIPGLPSQAAQGFQANPTLASGDVKIRKDGGAQANTTNLPTALNSGKAVQVVLTATEMTADRVVVEFSDQTSPAEWSDTSVTIFPSARTRDDYAFPATSGRSLAVDASGQVTVGAVANNAITAAAIAADAIGASELAADAVTEIQSGLATASALATVQADADDIQTRLPAALVSGRMDASVGAMAANVVTAAAIAADAIGASELAADAVTEIQSGLATASALATVQADTDDLQTRIPAALTADGLMKSDALRVGGTLQTGGDLAALLATIAGYIDTEVAAIKAKTDNLPSDPADASDIAAAFATAATAIGAVNTLATAIKAKTDNLPSDPADASDIAAAFVSLASAISALNNLSAATVRTQVDDGLAAYDAPTKAELDAAVAPLALEATVAAIDVPTATENADELLTRDWTLVAAPAGRSLLNAMRPNRNRVKVDAGTLTVYEEDDTTPAWTGAVTTAAGNPVTEVDPA